MDPGSRHRLAGLVDRHPLAIGEDGGGLLRRLELSEDVSLDVVTKARENGLLPLVVPETFNGTGDLNGDGAANDIVMRIYAIGEGKLESTDGIYGIRFGHNTM